MSGFKNLVGGEMQSYTTLMQEAREIALSRMQDEAARLCADAVIGVRYSSCEIAQGAARGAGLRYGGSNSVPAEPLRGVWAIFLLDPLIFWLT